jgi:Rad3-related DNA helicase|tara:strand:+ start:120 stop:1043 length:924 start_codon:yes stop_codon:yes gene_type:complete
MSSQGMTQAQLEARRRELERQQEEARRKKIKLQVSALAQAVERQQRQLAESGTGAWVQEEISEIMAVVKQAKNTPASGDIDAMFEQLNIQQAKISTLGGTSNQRQDALQREQWMAESAVIGLKLELEARLEDLEHNDSMEEVGVLLRTTEDLSNIVQKGQITKLQEQVAEIRQSALQIHEQDMKQSVDETLRREIITALMKTMRDLGFAVGKPTIDKETGGVIMIGTLPSNRSIRFEIDLNGQMEFDMNGFMERKCADHLDEVLGVLEANFSIATGPVQHNWKNPDKISKGSKGFPSGGNTRTMGGN